MLVVTVGRQLKEIKIKNDNMFHQTKRSEEREFRILNNKFRKEIKNRQNGFDLLILIMKNKKRTL